MNRNCGHIYAHLRTEFHNLYYSDSLVISIKPKAKTHIHTQTPDLAAITLWFYIQCNWTPVTYYSWRHIAVLHSRHLD